MAGKFNPYLETTTTTKKWYLLNTYFDEGQMLKTPKCSIILQYIAILLRSLHIIQYCDLKHFTYK